MKHLEEAENAKPNRWKKLGYPAEQNSDGEYTNFLGASTYAGFVRFGARIARERAEILALGGVQVAIALLTHEQENNQDKATHEKNLNPNKEKDPNYQDKKWLNRILPIINRWKTFNLKENIDGINGCLKVCISCEEAKLNLNRQLPTSFRVERASVPERKAKPVRWLIVLVSTASALFFSIIWLTK